MDQKIPASRSFNFVSGSEFPNLR